MLGGEDNLHSIRARTAISRTDLSRPLKCAIADRLIGTDTSVFDYGCGRGDDLRHLIAMGYKASAAGTRSTGPTTNGAGPKL